MKSVLLLQDSPPTFLQILGQHFCETEEWAGQQRLDSSFALAVGTFSPFVNQTLQNEQSFLESPSKKVIDKEESTCSRNVRKPSVLKVRPFIKWICEYLHFYNARDCLFQVVFFLIKLQPCLLTSFYRRICDGIAIRCNTRFCIREKVII